MILLGHCPTMDLVGDLEVEEVIDTSPPPPPEVLAHLDRAIREVAALARMPVVVEVVDIVVPVLTTEDREVLDTTFKHSEVVPQP